MYNECFLYRLYIRRADVSLIFLFSSSLESVRARLKRLIFLWSLLFFNIFMNYVIDICVLTIWPFFAHSRFRITKLLLRLHRTLEYISDSLSDGDDPAIARMRRLLVGVVFFTCNCIIWGQDVVFPTDEETSHVSGGNSTVIIRRRCKTDGKKNLSYVLMCFADNKWSFTRDVGRLPEEYAALSGRRSYEQLGVRL